MERADNDKRKELNNDSSINVENSQMALQVTQFIKEITMNKNSTKSLNEISMVKETSKKKSDNLILTQLQNRRAGFTFKDRDNFSVGRTSKKKISKSMTIRQTQNHEEDENKNRCTQKFKGFTKKYLNHNLELAIMTIVTSFALFGNDMKTIFLSPNYDPVFNGIFFIVMALFFLELGASLWVKQNYFKSFFFWLDLFASISMILEIDSILFPILNWFLSLSVSDENYSNKEVLIDSRRNHKLIMIVRVLRIIRLIRIVKLYKAAVFFFTNLENKKKAAKQLKKRLEKERRLKEREEKRRREEEKRKTVIQKRGIKKTASLVNKNKELDIHRDVGNEKETENQILKQNTTFYVQDNIPHRTSISKQSEALVEFQKLKEIEESVEMNSESNISRLVSDSISQRVIVIILLMLFITPLTDDDVYNSDERLSYLILCKFINNFVLIYGNIGGEYDIAITNFINNASDPYYPLINITYNDSKIIWVNTSIQNDTVMLRNLEIGYAFVPEGYTQIAYSLKQFSILSAVINLFRTICVIFILSLMTISLKKEAKRLILKPLEFMIDLVDAVAKDPISYKNITSLQSKVKNSIIKLSKKKKKDSSSNKKKLNIEAAEYEIKVIQLAIIKISALLAVGFGDAGGEILRENIASHEELNPMLAGKKKCAIFGFCDIRHFSEINVALQEKTMMFVNEIADIVHSCVDKYGGSANKNIGEAFLIVWKFPHLEKCFEDGEKKIDPLEEIKRADQHLNSHVADQAVLGYLSIIKKINKSRSILSYKNNPEIINQFGENFKVQMGFGLHFGWGIEGPIGSFYKIDCSYLSPNVNISARLEAATRQYGVSILISGEVYDLLSLELQSICRIIDIVTVKGSKTKIRLYTIYINNNLKPGKISKKVMSINEKRKYYSIKKVRLESDYKSLSLSSIGKLVLNKKGFRELLVDKKRPTLFYDKFKEGFNDYIEGKWDKAYYKFKDALFLDSNDGPTKTLFNYIKKHNKKAPENWRGVRELTSK